MLSNANEQPALLKAAEQWETYRNGISRYEVFVRQLVDACENPSADEDFEPDVVLKFDNSTYCLAPDECAAIIRAFKDEATELTRRQEQLEDNYSEGD